MYFHISVAVVIFIELWVFLFFLSLKEPIDITVGVTDRQATQMAENLGFTGQKAKQVKKI
jgi:hypothetical protein